MGYDLVLEALDIRAYYRRLLMADYSKEEAGNIIAKIMGLDITETPWTVKQLQHLAFLRNRDIKHTMPP